MRKLTLMLFILIIGLTVLLAACSDDSDSNPTPTQPEIADMKTTDPGDPPANYSQSDLDKLVATSYKFCMDCDLSGVDLSGKDLSRAHLTNVNLSGTNLTNANLSNAILTNVNLGDAVLSSAVLTGVQMFGGSVCGVYDITGITMNKDTLCNPNVNSNSW